MFLVSNVYKKAPNTFIWRKIRPSRWAFSARDWGGGVALVVTVVGRQEEQMKKARTPPLSSSE